MSTLWNTPRHLVERIIVTGTLTLQSPTHLGNGDSDGPLDMPLLLDAVDGYALLTGASIAGALRNYVHDYDSDQADALFGRVTTQSSHESVLIVDDALSKTKPDVELRDGVAIDLRTRTAADEKKFDVELLEAGTSFDLRFELLVQSKTGEKAISTLALALNGLHKGDIPIGKRKRRGYGECQVDTWTVQRFDMTTPIGLLSWLEEKPTSVTSGSNIFALLGQMPTDASNERCVLIGTFGLDGSLMIRSGGDESNAPDMVHLHSRRKHNKRPLPVLSGTSLAGVLRARAQRIINTLSSISTPNIALINDLFGYHRADQAGQPNNTQQQEESKKITASRLWVRESEVTQATSDQVHTRLKIDRLTGGAYPGALFSQQPLWARPETQLKIHLEIDRACDIDIGLILLLLKDLWTSDLALGGESSVGRGRLQGQSATLIYRSQVYTFGFDANAIFTLTTSQDATPAQNYVTALVAHITTGAHHDKS